MTKLEKTAFVYPQSRSEWRHNKTLEQKFWSKVDKRGPNECWPWLGAKGPHGHGALKLKGNHHLGATRASWFLAHGEWPTEGMEVCHRCDYPPCVNPAHLFLGTHSDNMRDCTAKGRNYKPGHLCRGTKNVNAKLDWDRVAELRRRYATGETLSSLARTFGMARSSLRRVVRGDGWRLAWQQ